ncbi:MAG: PAS domain S-box protein [Ignavibacteriales bacterium]|nr:MAG: PAS domain S-box protein [Ignavibacteriales bacterium]
MKPGSDSSASFRTTAETIINGLQNHENFTPEETFRLVRKLEDLHKQTEEKNEQLFQRLRESDFRKQQYQSQINSIPASLIIFNERGQIISANKTAADILEEDADSLYKKLFYNYLSTDSKAVFRLHLRNTFLESGTQSAELVLNTNYRSPSVFLIKSRSLNRQGELNRECYSVLIDYPEKRRTDEVLLENLERLSAIIEDQTELICRWSPVKKINFVNNSYCRYFNKKAEDLIGTDFNTFIVEKDKEKFDQSLLLLSPDNPLNIIEVRAVLPYGEVKWQQWTNKALFDKSGNIIEYQSVGRDITKQKRSEESLRISEERYRLAVENSPNQIFSVNKNGLLITWNKACEELFQFKREILGQSFTELLHSSSDVSEVQNMIQQVFEGKTFNIPELIFKSKDGTKKYLMVRLYPLIGNEKKIYACVFTATDLTERKKIELALRKSEELQRALFTGSVDPILITDINFKTIAANPALEKLIGYSSDELRGFTFPPNSAFDSTLIREWVEKCKSGEGVSGYETNISGRSDELIPVSMTISPIKNIKGELRYISFWLRDIKERKRIQEALRISEERMRLLLQSAEDIVLMQNLEGKILYYNGATKYGLTPGEVVGKSPYDFFEKDLAEILEKHVNEVAVSSKPLISEDEFHWQGEKMCFSNLLSPVKDENGKVIAVTIISRNITDKKKAEDALLESKIKLQELNASKDKFFSIVAHDLRSPFQGLIGFSNLLLEDYKSLDREEIREFVENINNSTKNLYKLIENLLEWSRIQTGRKEYFPQKIDLYETVDSELKLLSGNAANKNISLENLISNDTRVTADKNMLTSVLENLITNSIKFTNPGGEVKVYNNHLGEMIEVVVEDNGVGIRADDLQKLLRIDQQHSTEGTAQERGTGLGLMLVKEFVEKQGGTIRIESEFGKGTKVFFTLPRALNPITVDT